MYALLFLFLFWLTCFVSLCFLMKEKKVGGLVGGNDLGADGGEETDQSTMNEKNSIHKVNIKITYKNNLKF